MVLPWRRWTGGGYRWVEWPMDSSICLSDPGFGTHWYMPIDLEKHPKTSSEMYLNWVNLLQKSRQIIKC